MNIKVAIACWLSLRIQEQTRSERRALRDYSLQELGKDAPSGYTQPWAQPLRGLVTARRSKIQSTRPFGTAHAIRTRCLKDHLEGR